MLFLVKMSTSLKDLKGKPIQRAPQDGAVPADLAYVCSVALIAPIQATGEEKFRRAELAERIHHCDPVMKLTEEEITLLRTAVGEVFAQPEVVRAAWKALDEREPAPEPVTLDSVRKKVRK